MSSLPLTSGPEPGAKAVPRVLVADDSRVMQHAIRKILVNEFDLVQVEDGESAWKQLANDPSIQVLITDIEMPELNGYGLICRIRAADDERLRELPVITITGAEDDETKQHAFACGATDFITKPIDAIQLMARVKASVKFDHAARVIAEQAETLEAQSISDLLTGLPSRRYLLQRGDQDLAYAKRNDGDLALIRINIDNFRQHFRALGEDLGDALLAWVARLLIENARTEDTVARIAGAEFAVLVNGIGLTETAVMAERVRASISSQPFSEGGKSISVTISIGMSSLRQDRSSDLESLLRLASQRAVHAQSEGGNRLCGLIPGEAPEDVEELTVGDVPVIVEDAPANIDLPKGEALGVVEELSAGDLSATVDETPGDLEMTLETPVVGADVPNSAGEELNLVEIELPTLDYIDMPLEPSVPELPEQKKVSAGESPGVEEALDMLAQGEESRLLPYLDKLMQKLKPLIDLYDRTRR